MANQRCNTTLVPNRDGILAELQTQRSTFSAGLVAPNTERGYRYDSEAFRRWAAQMGLDALPASPDTLSLYATAMLTRGLKVSTANRRVAAVAHLHRSEGHVSPVDDEVRSVLRGAKRIRAERVEQVLPLALEELRAISSVMRSDDTARSSRNWAILLVGFAAALRNSMSAALRLDDVEFTGEGAVLKIRRNKNDQEGRGRIIGLPHGKHPETCPVQALRDWIRRRGAEPGPLFTRFDGHPPIDRALQPERIGQIVQACIARIGLDVRLYGGHSLRAGFCTEAAECGAPEIVIAATTGHRDMSTLRMYFRRRDAFKRNALTMMDL